MKTIVVLQDGETWMSLHNSSICVLSDEDMERLENDEVRAKDLTPLVEITLRDETLFRKILP
jgi:hypothetical protein